jgi:copper transport protein
MTAQRRQSAGGRWIAALAVVLLALGAVPPASAHARLSTTSPDAGEVVETSPSRVTLRFDEPVEGAFASIRVVDTEGRRVDDGRTIRPWEDELAVGIDRELAPGTYVVAWRVVSEDSHPLHGRFAFHVRAKSQGDAAGRELDEPGDPAALPRAATVVRGLAIALILLLAGGTGALAVWVPSEDAVRPARRRLWLLLAGLGTLLVPVTAAGIGLQGAASAGLGLDAVTRWSLAADVLETRFGKAALARIVLGLAIVGVALAARSLGGRVERTLALAACSLGALLAATPALAGHSQVEGPPAVLANAVHVEAAALWAGGLVFLLLLLGWSGARRWEVAAGAVPAFSAVALVAVAALIVGGVVNSVVEVGSWDGLRETTYGRLLLLKLAFVVPVLALGAFNNRVSVRRLEQGTTGGGSSAPPSRSSGCSSRSLRSPPCSSPRRRPNVPRPTVRQPAARPRSSSRDRVPSAG